MSRARITRILMVLFVIMLTTVLAGAAQKKNNPPPAPKQAPAAKPAPAATPAPAAAKIPTTTRRTTTTQRLTTTQRPLTTRRIETTRPQTTRRTQTTRQQTTTQRQQTTRQITTTGNHENPQAPEVRKLGSGKTATVAQNGNIRGFHDPKRNMTVERGIRPGDRRIESVDRNGHRLVSMGPHRGFVERPYYSDHFGHAYVQRTYWAHGHAYAYAYRDHFYRGRHYYWYAPRYYYHPGFYGWAYNPWAAPVAYNWGWGPAAPWFYGGYFAPAPVYPTASLWLTDYLLAENLKLAYEAKQEEPQPLDTGAPSTPMSPEVKQMVDAEVHRELQAEQAVSQSPQTKTVNDQAPPPSVDPKQRLFVVSSNLGVSTADGQECELTPGDVITRIENTPGSDSKVEVSVMSSKSNDCEIGSSPRVAVADLQEMYNNFRQQLDAGVDALAKNSGTGGLPKAPDTQTSAGQVPPPTRDSGVDKQLAGQQTEADQAEKEVKQEVGTSQTPASQ